MSPALPRANACAELAQLHLNPSLPSHIFAHASLFASAASNLTSAEDMPLRDDNSPRRSQYSVKRLHRVFRCCVVALGLWGPAKAAGLRERRGVRCWKTLLVRTAFRREPNSAALRPRRE